MKKLISAFLSVFMFLLLLVPQAQAANVSVTYNGTPVIFPDQAPFINSDNRTMVPVRAPMEAIGATVTWNNATRQATIKKDDTTAVFTIGSKQYTVNGKTQHMDTTAQITSNRTVFPIRFVAEAIGLTVGWDPQTYIVSIKTSETPETPPEETNTTSTQKPMNALTPEAKARLMAYPYPAGVNIYSPMVKYTEESIKAGYSGTHLQEVTQSWLSQKSLILPNQQFFFDSDLCYSCSGKFGERVRGVLQSKNNDGSITEQDVEFGFNYGAEFVPEGQTPQPAHLLEGNAFIKLNSPFYL